MAPPERPATAGKARDRSGLGTAPQLPPATSDAGPSRDRESIRGVRERGQTDAGLWKRLSKNIETPGGVGGIAARDRGRLVAELRFTGPGSFAIRSADEPVMALHHRVGEEYLPLDGSNRENREAAVVRELAESVGVNGHRELTNPRHSSA